MGRPSRLKVLPVAVKLLPGEMTEILPPGKKVVPEKLVRSGFGFKCFSPDQALKAIFPE